MYHVPVSLGRMSIYSHNIYISDRSMRTTLEVWAATSQSCQLRSTVWVRRPPRNYRSSDANRAMLRATPMAIYCTVRLCQSVVLKLNTASTKEDLFAPHFQCGPRRANHASSDPLYGFGADLLSGCAGNNHAVQCHVQTTDMEQ